MRISYSFGSGLGESGGSRISYTVEGNQLVVEASLGFGGSTKRTFNLDNETLVQINGVVNRANEYYKTPEGKEKPFVFDGFCNAEGITDSGEKFEFKNNEKGIVIIDGIETIVKEKIPTLEEEIGQMYLELEKKAQEYKDSLTKSFYGIDSVKEKNDISFKFGTFSGLDMLDTMYAIEGNKLIVSVSKLGNTSEVVVELDEETLEKIKGIIDEVGRYAKDNANKEKPFVYDSSSYIKGKTSSGEEINLENDIEAMNIVFRIFEIVKQKNPTFEGELNQRYAELTSDKVAQTYEDSLIDRIKGIKAEVNNEKQQTVQSPEPSLIELHPELYDVNGQLKPDSVRLIDELIKTYAAKKTETVESAKGLW